MKETEQKQQEEIKTDERQGGTSASSAPYDALCEGRHLAQKGIPEDVDEWSTFGSEVHEALATGDNSKLNTQQVDIFESCQEIEAKLVKMVFGTETPAEKPIRERRFWVRIKDRQDANKVYRHSGKVDAVYQVGPTLLVIEYKSLPGEHQASPENLQLRDQAVLASRSLKASEVFTAVIQPLVTHSPELCRYDKNALDKSEVEMCDRVRASWNPKGRTPGMFQCKFCRATKVCKEYAAWSSDQLPLTTRDPWQAVMAEWIPEQKALAAARIPIMKKLVKDTEQFLKQSLKDDPDSIPGFFLSPGDKRSKVSDPEALFARFVELGGTLDGFMKCVTITKKELEEQVRAVTNTKGKALKVNINTLLSGIVEEKENEPSLERKKS
jgi:hypothetical protein